MAFKQRMLKCIPTLAALVLYGAGPAFRPYAVPLEVCVGPG